MTRQEIIDSLQTCRNAKCYDCIYQDVNYEDGYPECMGNLIEGITPTIIHELNRIDRVVKEIEETQSKHISIARMANRSTPSMTMYSHYLTKVQLLEIILTSLKGDDTHANPSQP